MRAAVDLALRSGLRSDVSGKSGPRVWTPRESSTGDPKASRDQYHGYLRLMQL